MNENKLTAIIFGASGLTGKFVLEHLLYDNRYAEIKLFVRKELKVTSGKIKQILYRQDDMESVAQEIKGDHLFCCIGSTIKKAGSRDTFYKIDHDLVERIAKYASANKVASFVVVSSIGADHESRNFYLNTKGKMEESIKTFPFNNLSIVRPSMLLGIRHERRGLEEIGKIFGKLFAPLMVGSMRKYRPVHASTVAKAMIALANKPKGVNIVESDKLEEIASVKIN